MDIETVRDWVIIIYGIFGIITFLTITVVVAAIGYVVIKLVGVINGTIEERVNPALGAVQDTAHSVQNGASFVFEVTTAPVIRVYSFVSGVRRGVAVFSGLRRRGSSSGPKEGGAP